MDKEEKLTKEELLDGLESMKGRALEYTGNYPDMTPEEDIYKQAYTQLKEIVEEHYRRKDFTKGYEIKQIQQKPDEDTAEWMDRCHELELEVARLQEKLEVGDD